MPPEAEQGTAAGTEAVGPSLREPHLGWALAGLSAGAGAIHLAMTPIHAASASMAIGFAAAGWFQLVTAALVLTRPRPRSLYQAIALANLVFIGAWIASRTVGLPFGEAPNVAEPVGAIDALCALLELGAVLVAARLALAPDRTTARFVPAAIAVGALGLATLAIASPDAVDHGHGDAKGDEVAGLDALQRTVDEERCDRDLNIPAYYDEAELLGVDTRWGGDPPGVAGAPATSSDGHAHGAGAAGTSSTTTADPDPLQGRGSPGLDRLVSATGLAATGEADVANLISSLGAASQEDYDAWLRWLRSSGALDHEHASSSTGDDGAGHGDHVGPQPWVALVDQELCDATAAELALARTTAMAYPTAQDAKDAGYRLADGYVPGLAAHWIKASLIDDTFEITQPEMILYDGNGLDAEVVGLSYYLWHPGDEPPTQGFTGDNDRGHRHLGLCTNRETAEIIDEGTEAGCPASDGSTADGSEGWMFHAWVVEGCESPWGVFSDYNPVLDWALAEASGTDGGHCAGSGMRDRYGMDDQRGD